MVPHSLREGSLALGAAHWQAILKVVLPATHGGVITGLLLAIAAAWARRPPYIHRGTDPMVERQRLSRQHYSLPVQIYVYTISPDDNWHKLAWASGPSCWSPWSSCSVFRPAPVLLLPAAA